MVFSIHKDYSLAGESYVTLKTLGSTEISYPQSSEEIAIVNTFLKIKIKKIFFSSTGSLLLLSLVSFVVEQRL